MVSSYMGRPILYALLIWNHFTAAFSRYGTLFDLEGYKHPVSNKYKLYKLGVYTPLNQIMSHISKTLQ